MALPIPRAAPVTMAVFPSNNFICTCLNDSYKNFDDKGSLFLKLSKKTSYKSIVAILI
jgi:hypothetical protein